MAVAPGISVAALVLIRDGDSVLLVKQSYNDHFWSLPGGGVEPGESVDQAAIREVREETGLEVCLKRVVGIYSKPRENGLAITFEGEVIGGDLLQATNETSACQYWPFDHLLEPARAHLRERVEDFRRDLPGAVVRSQ